MYCSLKYYLNLIFAKKPPHLIGGSNPCGFGVSWNAQYTLSMLYFVYFRLFGCTEDLRPMVEGANNSKFVLEGLVAIKLEVLVPMGGLTVYSEWETAIITSLGFNVQHGQALLIIFFLSCELDIWMNRVDMRGELLQNPSSIATPVSSTYRFHSCSSALKVARACSSNHSTNKFATIGLTGEPMAVPSTWM